MCGTVSSGVFRSLFGAWRNLGMSAGSCWPSTEEMRLESIASSAPPPAGSGVASPAIWLLTRRRRCV